MNFEEENELKSRLIVKSKQIENYPIECTICSIIIANWRD